MKKLFAFALIAVGVLSLTSCMNDDGPNINYEVAEITGHDLPEYFEEGEEYEINVDYLLPSACHSFYGFQTGNEENEDDETIFEYYIQVQTSYDPNLTECTEEDDDLEKTAELIDDFEIKSENDYTTYRFNFITGYDSDGNPEYLTVDVPVGAPDDNGDEEENGDEENNDDSNE